MVKPLMMHCRASHTVDMACIVQNLPLVLYPSGRKTAHRGTPARCQSAPGKTRLQTMMPSGKNLRRATTARQTHLLPQTGKCWNGQQGDATDFLSGLARQVGNDLSALLGGLGSLITWTDPSGDGNVFGSDNTNAGIFGSDLAPAAELLAPVGRLGYVLDVGGIPGTAGITGPGAVAARNAFKVDYRVGLFPNTGMGSYDAFVAAGKTDPQIIASAGRTNAGVNSAAATSAAAAAAHSGCP